MSKAKKAPVTDVLLYVKASRVGGDLTILFSVRLHHKRNWAEL